MNCIYNLGIWTRDLRHKTNILSGVLTKILKSFESKKHIKSVKTVAVSENEYLTSTCEKIYIYHLYFAIGEREIEYTNFFFLLIL